MVEVLKILYDAGIYCVKATAELFWTGLRWLFYDIPIFIKSTYGEEPYKMQIIEPNEKQSEESSIIEEPFNSNAKTAYKAQENNNATGEDGNASIYRFIKALGFGEKKAS